MTQRRGKFITFEGIDGSGKSSVMRKIIFSQTDGQRMIVETFEPFNSKIRDLITSTPSMPLDAQLCLFEADRIEHWDTFIKPKLDAGFTVLCDRYIDSSSAYQSNANNSIADIMVRYGKVRPDAMPDLTLLLEADDAVCAERLQKRDPAHNDPLDALSRAHRETIRQNYKTIQKIDPIRIISVDSNWSVESTATACLKIISDKLGII